MEWSRNYFTHVFSLFWSPFYTHCTYKRSKPFFVWLFLVALVMTMLWPRLWPNKDEWCDTAIRNVQKCDWRLQTEISCGLQSYHSHGVVRLHWINNRQFPRRPTDIVNTIRATSAVWRTQSNRFRSRRNINQFDYIFFPPDSCAQPTAPELPERVRRRRNSSSSSSRAPVTHCQQSWQCHDRAATHTKNPQRFDNNFFGRRI